MADYSITNLLKSGGTGDMTQLLASLQNDLPVMYAQSYTEAATSTTSASYVDIDTNTITVDADEAVFVWYRANLGCNSVSTNYIYADIRVTINGVEVGSTVNWVPIEISTEEGVTAFTMGYAVGNSGSINVKSQALVHWDTGGPDTLYIGFRHMLIMRCKYRTA